MLKSPWMLLAVVPGGFLLVAAAAAFGPAQSVTAAAVFAGLAALSLVIGALFTFTFARRPAVPALAALRRFARDWVRNHPGATEAETGAALARWFGGSNWEYAVSGTSSPGSPGDVLAGAVLFAVAVGLWHRFFPAAPARPEDIETVLGELRGEDAFGQM